MATNEHKYEISLILRKHFFKRDLRSVIILTPRANDFKLRTIRRNSMFSPSNQQQLGANLTKTTETQQIDVFKSGVAWNAWKRTSATLRL
jgi:hypothetical protein